MNKKTEKWLIVCSLGSWMASLGAMIAIEISSQPLQVTEPALSYELIEQPFQATSVLDRTRYKNSEQSVLRLLPHSGHWLDHGLPSDEDLEIRDVQLIRPHPNSSPQGEGLSDISGFLS
jgi:hypothetical protein